MVGGSDLVKQREQLGMFGFRVFVGLAWAICWFGVSSGYKVVF